MSIKPFRRNGRGFLVDISVNCFYEKRMTIFRPQHRIAELRADNGQRLAPVDAFFLAVNTDPKGQRPDLSFYRAVRLDRAITVEGVSVPCGRNQFSKDCQELPEGSVLLMHDSRDDIVGPWYGLSPEQQHELGLLRARVDARPQPVQAFGRLGEQAEALKGWLNGPQRQAHIQDVRTLCQLGFLRRHRKDTPAQLGIFGIKFDLKS